MSQKFEKKSILNLSFSNELMITKNEDEKHFENRIQKQ